MVESRFLAEEIITNCNQSYTGYYTQSNVSRKAPNVSGLQHHQYFLRKGGEGCKTATEAYSKEQGPMTAFGAALAEYAPQEADKEASHKVYCKRCPRESLTDALHSQRYQISARSSQEAAGTNRQYGFDKIHRLISYSDYASVFFLLFSSAFGRLEGMEVPGDAQPEHPAAVFTVVHQREHRVIGMYVPTSGVEHVCE